MFNNLRTSICSGFKIIFNLFIYINFVFKIIKYNQIKNSVTILWFKKIVIKIKRLKNGIVTYFVKNQWNWYVYFSNRDQNGYLNVAYMGTGNSIQRFFWLGNI